jgi:hypothetical protein
MKAVLALFLLLVGAVPALGQISGPAPGGADRPRKSLPPGDGVSPTKSPHPTKSVAPANIVAPAKPELETIRLTLRPAAAPVPALKYHLLPELRQVQSGNAVFLYYRAFSPEWSGTFLRPEASKALDAWADSRRKPPGKELRRLADSVALKEIDRGARRTHADWELIERLREDGIALLLPDIQSFRRYALLLAIRARFEMMDGRLDKAVHTFQTALKLGRDIADAPTLIQTLVGIAISTMTLEQVEEFIQTPASPNLYWALTQLPAPFVDLRKPYQGERIMIDSFFPELRDALAGEKPRVMSVAEVQAMVERLARQMRDMHMAPPYYNWQARLGLAAMAAQSYPKARRFLRSQGLSAEEAEAMPVIQAALLFEIYNYDRFFDDFRKWAGFPYWQAQPALLQTEQRLKQAKAAEPGNGALLATLLLPAVMKVQYAVARTDRRIAALRVIEAIRLYMAAHEGKLPARLDDIKAAPVPSDPVTGRAFEYTVTGNQAILYGPPLGQETPGPHNTLRYELNLHR